MITTVTLNVSVDKAYYIKGIVCLLYTSDAADE